MNPVSDSSETELRMSSIFKMGNNAQKVRISELQKAGKAVRTQASKLREVLNLSTQPSLNKRQQKKCLKETSWNKVS